MHPSTVSRALDPRSQHLVTEAKREQILAVAQRLGYRSNLVARSLRRNRTDTIGVVVSDLENPIITGILHGLDTSLRQSGFLTLISETQDSSSSFEKILEHLVARSVDAIVVTAATVDDGPLLERIGAVVPVIVAVRPVTGIDLPVIAQDDVLGGRLVADHFAAHGHDLVAQLRGPANVLNFARRAEGFSTTCAERGITEIRMSGPAAAPSAEEGARVMQLVLQRKRRPTAVFAHNDLMAMGALRVIKRLGLRCPEDIAVAGYNNMAFLDLLAPPLTSVVIDVEAVSACAGETALTWITTGEMPPTPHLPPPTLIARTSTTG